MSMIMTIEISEETARIVQQMAQRTGRSPDAVLRELIDRSVAEAPIEALPDDEVLALSVHTRDISSQMFAR